MIFLNLFALLLFFTVLEARDICPEHFHLSPGNFCIGAVEAFSDHTLKTKQCPYGFNIFSYDTTNKSLTDILLNITEDDKVYHVKSGFGKADLILRFNGRIIARSMESKTFNATCKKLGKSFCVDENVMSTICNSYLCKTYTVIKTRCSAAGKRIVRTWISQVSLSSDEYCTFMNMTYIRVSEGERYICYPDIYVNNTKSIHGCNHYYNDFQHCKPKNFVTDNSFTVNSKRTTAKRKLKATTTPALVSPTSSHLISSKEVYGPADQDNLTDVFELNTDISTNEESRTSISVPFNQTNGDENNSTYTSDTFANATGKLISPGTFESNAIPTDYYNFSSKSMDMTVTTVVVHDNFTGPFEISTVAHMGNETNSSINISSCNPNSKSPYHQFPPNIDTSDAGYIAGIIILSLCIVLLIAGFIFHQQYKKYTDIPNIEDVPMANVLRETE